MTDRDLAHALRSNSLNCADAYELLYDAYGEELYLHCWQRLRDPDMARIALRDTFIVARAHIDRLADTRCLRDWLLAVAGCECERQQSRCPTTASGTRDLEWPVGLRLRVLSCVTGPDLAACRTHIAARADCFDRRGFPVPLSKRRDGTRLARVIPGLIVAVCAVLVFVLAFYVYARTKPEEITSRMVDSPVPTAG